ncbi:hypothetical protein [Candidatus Contubernalis alkaliaceticus]|uniref:hypothetical protein n=1 Tax=Candidatus Contubernalis alkaliaceticus TaxID=338645 RepID=UPI001F4C047B|nr:hypothetical protein [Candidatus Contubernalis alkalaceticus]UNC92727.1 hypothetical protein HUE98_11840 [Candidatus Contubernalis alkalaceticus]
MNIYLKQFFEEEIKAARQGWEQVEGELLEYLDSIEDMDELKEICECVCKMFASYTDGAKKFYKKFEDYIEKRSGSISDDDKKKNDLIRKLINENNFQLDLDDLLGNKINNIVYVKKPKWFS